MSFDNLQLHPKILQAIAEAKYTVPTEIQLKAIPKVLEGLDIRGSAQTGTGKTAAFLLPALHRIMTVDSPKGRKGPRVLIVAPTRELATQIATQSEKYSKYLNGVKTVAIGGGVPYEKQRGKLARPYDILVATPGRLIDFMHQRRIDLSDVEIVVLDEADRMLDMGFLDPVEEIMSATPTSRQTLLFSATLRGPIARLSKRFLKEPVDVEIHTEHAKHDNIKQRLHFVDNLEHKNRLLDHLLKEDGVEYSIIFTSTKRHADQLVHELYDNGHEAGALHGDMSQRQRTRMIQNLRMGKVRVLVATDVAARGLDVQSITHVINFDLPRNIEDYVHRIGRTGRAGSMGTAISFAAGRDRDLVRKIEAFTGHKIDIVELPGFEPTGKREKRPYNKDDNRSFDKRAKRPFKKDENRSFKKREDRPFNRDEKRPFTKREDRPFNRDEKRPFTKREDRPFKRDETRSFAKREDRPFKRDDDRPFTSREDRPFKRDETRSFNKEEKRPYGPKKSKPFGERRAQGPFKPKENGSGPAGRGRRKPKDFSKPGFSK